MSNYTLSPYVIIRTYGERVLIIDSMNGGALTLDKPAFETLTSICTSKNQINDRTFSNEETLLLSYALNAGIIVYKNKVDYDKSLSQILKVAYIEVTNECNLRCPYCYANSEPLKEPTIFPKTQIKKVLDSLFTKGVELIVVSGGEPLLYPSITISIGEYAILCGKKSALLTNGTLKFSSTKLGQICNAFDVIQISLDGSNEEVNACTRGIGNFDRTVSFARTVKRLHLMGTRAKPYLSCTFGQVNYKNVLSLIDLAYKEGFGFPQINPCFPIPFSRGYSWSKVASPEEILDTLKGIAEAKEKLIVNNTTLLEKLPSIGHRFNCGAGANILSISANGTVYPCHGLHKSKLFLGNIFEDSIDEITERGYKFSTDYHVDTRPICKDCEIRYLCGGGCIALSYIKRKPFKEYCEIFKYLVEVNLDYFFLFEKIISREKVKHLSTKQFLDKIYRTK